MALINVNSGGLLDTAATDPTTVAAGIQVNGAAPTNVGLLDPALNLLGNQVLGAGITSTLANADITNDGTITGSGSTAVLTNVLNTLVPGLGGAVQPTASGVEMLLGGTVGNAADGTITGALDGVYNAANAANVTNAGLISGAAGAGVDLLGGGTVVNTGSAATNQGITGVTAGVTIGGTPAGATSGVTNSGSISASAGPGVSLDLGQVANDLGGTIASTGVGGIGVDLKGTGTVTNAGVITGTAGAGGDPAVAVRLGGADSMLTLAAGETMNGMAVATAAATNATLMLTTGSETTNTVADVGNTITGFANMVVDSGVTGAVTGALGNAAGTPTAVSLLGNDSLTVGGPVAANVTVGTANSTGAAIALNGSVAQGATVDLSGTNAKLTLGDLADFAGTIANLGADDILDLTGLAAGTTVAVDPGVGLTVTGPNGTPTTLKVALPVNATLKLDASGTGVSVGVGLGLGGTGTTITVGAGTDPGTGGGTNPGTGGGTNPGTGGGTNPGTGGGTNPGTGGGTNPGGTTVTGGGTTSTDPSTGATTVTTTSPAGSTTTQILPPGSTVSQDPTTGDVVSIDPAAAFVGRGVFQVTGHVAAASGVTSVTLSAVIDGAAPTVLGTASVAADGSYSFLDRVGAHLQGFITATETDGLGNTNAVQSPFSLRAGIQGGGHAAEQDRYTPDGTAEVALTSYKQDGSSRVDVRDAGQTLQSNFFDTFNNGGAPENTFVFNPGHGLDTVNLFRANGLDHDTISLPSADFQNMAAVMSNTQNVAGGALITDPTTGDAVKLTGVSKAELKANPSDFTFHA